jgi:hypothetical protein
MHMQAMEGTIHIFTRKLAHAHCLTGHLIPNFVDHLVMFIKHGLHQKSHISGHLLRQPPLPESALLIMALLSG